MLKLQFTKKWLGSAADTLIARANEESESAAQIWMFANSAASALIKRPLSLALIKNGHWTCFQTKSALMKWAALKKIKWSLAFDKIGRPLKKRPLGRFSLEEARPCH